VNATSSKTLSIVLPMSFLLLCFLAGVAGLILPSPSPDLTKALLPVRGLWAFGTDPIGRPIEILILKSYSTLLMVVVPAVLLSGVIGVFIGLLSGSFGGWVDLILMRLVDLFLAFPGMLIAIFFASVLGTGALPLTLALTLSGWTGFARLVRGEILRLRAQPFVESARSQGIPPGRLYLRHIFPHLFSVLVAQTILTLQGGILAEAGLSFLGLTDPGIPSLGKLLNEGVRYLRIAPHLTLIPALFLFLTLLSLYELGDRWVERMNRSLLDTMEKGLSPGVREGFGADSLPPYP
jgi:peptide/nickel transport system permease protein